MEFLINLIRTALLLLFPLQCFDPLQNICMDDTTFDFIIVGAGSAGAVVASRLSEITNVKVLLLEAGDCPVFWSQIPALGPTQFKTNSDWQYKIAPQKDTFLAYSNHQCNYPQGKVLGGTGTLNDLVYLRGNHKDYDGWAELGNQGWSWNDILPYFLKAEKNRIKWIANDTTFHNSSGVMPVSESPFKTTSVNNFLKSGEQLGYKISDINGPSQIGISRLPLNLNNGDRSSSFTAYLQPAISRSNLAVVTGALVHKVLFNNNKEAIGVKYVKNGQICTAKASKEVILSAGAFNSPKLLKLSGVGEASELQSLNIKVIADLPGVGKNLQDHVSCGHMIWKVNCSDCTNSIQKLMSINAIGQWVLSRQGPLTLPFGAEGLIYLKPNSENQNDDWPFVQIEYVSLNIAGETDQYAAVTGASKDILAQYFGVYANEKTFSMFPFLHRVKSRGTLSLKNNDPTAAPIIDFQYLTDPDDIKNLVEGVKAAYNLGNTAAFKDIGAEFIPTVFPGCEHFTQYTDNYWECACRHMTVASYHPTGTCKMGISSDSSAVVNANLSVYKVQKLRVIDGSIMPNIITGNTNAPIVAIAEKSSVIIKETYGFN